MDNIKIIGLVFWGENSMADHEMNADAGAVWLELSLADCIDDLIHAPQSKAFHLGIAWCRRKVLW